MSCSSYFFILFFMSLFHLCLSTQSFNHVRCKYVERQALLNFKHGLIDPANKLASWVDEDKECCKWAGIVCDNFTGHVHQIHLRGLDGHCHLFDSITGEEDDKVSKKMLGGDLSPSLLHLKQLKHLDLSCNDFGGIQVPSFIGSLGNLKYLNLSISKFGGTIPPHLGNLSKLQVLGLGSFYDFGSESTSILNMQWLSSLHLLRHLDMSGVELYKAVDWLQVTSTLPSLAELHLSGCQLSHIHPHVPRILNLTSLSLLDLSRNYFDNSFAPPWIFSITSLVSLDLSGCNFQGVVPSNFNAFHNLTSLELLDVSGNNFMNSSLVLKGLSSTIGSNLISLGIGSCGISDSGLVALHNFTSLLSLDLSGNQLTQAIPKSLGNLCNLREIDLSSNHFDNINSTYLLESFFKCKSPALESLILSFSNLSGHLPIQLGQLIHLVHLNLEYNMIAGNIPDSVGQLSSLRSLQLHGNLLSGLVPYSIRELLSLEMLDLSNNRLNGSLPDSIGQLSELNYLDISSNMLTSFVTEAHFDKLSRLKYLSGRGNNLILRPQVANWTPRFQLDFLFLRSWRLGPQFPLWLQLQRDLLALDISNTSISAPMPRSFWSTFTKLTYLDMSQNHIQGTLFSIPAGIGMLDLSSNKFTGQLPYISNGSGPYFLDLSNNFFGGSLHHMLCPYDENSVTWYLNLGNNNLSGVIPGCRVKWSRLFTLNLENNNLSGEIPRTLGFFLSSLFSLNMRGNKLSGSLPTSFMNLTGLRFLQLSRNELVGSIPTWFGRELSSLIILKLRSNNFDGSIPWELCHLTSIQILDLAHNNLSGPIPRCFNNFTVLSQKESRVFSSMEYEVPSMGKQAIISESLVTKGREDTYDTILGLVMLMDLSSNKFSGNIPSELMSLQELRSLNLSRNQLTGRIPKNIGDMKSLESFDLSLNKLDGELPINISTLTSLNNFNVSYNSFTGRIPSSTQLQSLEESSFIGNNLCGDPLTRPCVVAKPYIPQEVDDGSDGADWGLIISIAVGLGVGFWIIMAPLIVSRSWRIAYFRFLTGLGYMVYDVIQKYCCKMFLK